MENASRNPHTVVSAVIRILRDSLPPPITRHTTAIRTNPRPQNVSIMLASFLIRLRSQTQSIKTAVAARVMVSTASIVRRQKTEVRSQKSEVAGRRAEVGDPRSDVGKCFSLPSDF